MEVEEKSLGLENSSDAWRPPLPQNGRRGARASPEEGRSRGHQRTVVGVPTARRRPRGMELKGQSSQGVRHGGV